MTAFKASPPVFWYIIMHLLSVLTLRTVLQELPILVQWSALNFACGVTVVLVHSNKESLEEGTDGSLRGNFPGHDQMKKCKKILL